MKRIFVSILVAGVVLLILSLLLIFLEIRFFPGLVEEYFSPVFRWSDTRTNWMFYVHPFVVSFALKWFWERYKDLFKGGDLLRAFEVALVYGIIAMVPVLWVTYSAIDISLGLVLTWLAYGVLQAFIAGYIFSKINP
jgi:hypothetical protein